MSNHSESINELAAALAKAQGAMQPAKMDAVNPFLKNRYADLGAVIQASRKPLAENGLSISQLPSVGDGKVSVTTILMHSSGQWIESEITLPIDNSKGLSLAQSMGVVITYLRRYSLASVLGIYADDDTDGNDTKPAQPAPKAQPAARPAPVVNEAETLKELGYEGNPPAQKMSIEQAEAEVSTTTGETYGSIETETLSYRLNQMLKAKAPTAEQQRKIDAARIILEARKVGRPVQTA